MRKTKLMKSGIFGRISYKKCYENAKKCFYAAGFNDSFYGTGAKPVKMLAVACAYIKIYKKSVNNKYAELLKFARCFAAIDGSAELDELAQRNDFKGVIDEIQKSKISEKEYDFYLDVIKYFLIRDSERMNPERRKLMRDEFNHEKIETLVFIRNSLTISLGTKMKTDVKSTDKDKESEAKKAEEKRILSSPKSINDYLKRFIIGQDEAIITISNVIYQFCKYREIKKKSPKRYNILVIGPSGCGKTSIVRALSKIMKVEIIDCTGTTESGYSGANAKDLIKRTHDGDIVFFDEMDKILMPSYDGMSRNTHTEIQSCFYPMMEEQNSLNIFAGAFEGLDEIVESRLKSEKSFMGFGSKCGVIRKEDLQDVKEEDLREFGATVEFLGRVDLIILMSHLSKEDYYRILTESEFSPVLLEKEVAKDCYNLELTFSDKCYMELAEKAASKQVGARSMKQYINTKVDPLLAEGLENKKTELWINSLDEEDGYIFDRIEKEDKEESAKVTEKAEKEEKAKEFIKEEKGGLAS